MDREQLLAEWQDILQCDEALTPDTDLSVLEEWDSLSQVAMSAFFERRLGSHVSSEKIAQCKNIRDLLALAEKA